MLRLFLENYEIELNETVQFALNRQFEDLTNPTIIINDWSKTIKIPFSSHNDKIFGHIYNLDRVIADGDNKLMGIYFDPYKKIDFRLQWGDAILMTGYAKNISVDNGSYNITLNGELGKIFQEMKKITFNTATEDTNYLIDGSKYVNEYITKDLIYDIWHNAGGLNTTLYENTEQDYRLEEMIGFIPNNSYNEGFDYTIFEIELEDGTAASKKFTEVLDEKAVNEGYESYEEATGIAADTVIKNGLLPREIGEFRSYLQQPYIFFNKLFQIFNKKVEEVTGYSSYLSPVWFNDSNPYWAQLVYVLNILDKKSTQEFTLNDLWNNEYNLFEQVLNYCKQFRIGILCDYVNKQIQYIPLDKYFNDYSVLDWTDKVDYSKDYHIEPITFQNKYILFNYDENDTEINKEYKEKYQFQFGEYRLTTDYNFNTDTKSLFEKINVSIPATDTILSWGSIYNELKVGYTVPAEITVINKGENNKYTNTFGSYLFYKGLQPFDTTSGLRPVIISDDTGYQALSNTYFYTQDGDSDKIVSIDTYPVLDIVYSNNISTFVKPLLNYTYQKDSYNNSYGIYENFWSEYLDERYNKQNKILTCYIYITPQDYINFQFNKFIKIQNQLYFINKIYDYQLEENIPTKVDLITIQNIESYTKNNFVIFNIYNSGGSLWNDHWDYLDIEQHTTKTIYITSNSDINWSTDQGLQLVEVNGEVGQGIIPAGNRVPVNIYNDEYGPAEGYIEFSNNIETQKIFVRVR